MPGSNADADTIQTASTRIERAITEPAVRVGETDVRRLSSADAQVTALQADDLGAGKGTSPRQPPVMQPTGTSSPTSTTSIRTHRSS